MSAAGVVSESGGESPEAAGTGEAPWVDLHNHLVPGVDDGARDLQSALAAVGRMREVGIRRIVTTPHIRGSLTLDPERLEERLREVGDAFDRASAAVAERFPDVEYRRGHEVLVDAPELDCSDPRLRLAGTRFVLIEWPRLHLPPGTVRVIEDIGKQGYRAVVAHPERYHGLRRSLELVGRWRELGAYLQVNFGSLVGRYGSSAQEAAERLLELGWVDYLASDYHGQPSLRIYRRAAEEYFRERGALETFDLLLRGNPALLLANRAPLPVPELPADTKLLRRIRGLMRRKSE